MQPPHHHSRINLAELKAQIVKRVGQEGSKQYFHFLNSFLNLKLSKVEFNKLCLRILGQENIPLHNQLIRSILRNASTAKTPPPPNPKDDGYLQNGSYANVAQASGLSNGSIRDRDWRIAVGPNSNGKANFATPAVVLENGDLNPIAKTSILRRSPDFSSPSCSKDHEEASTRSPLRAPLGIGGLRKSLPISSNSRCISAFNNGGLLDSLMLKERMQQIARIEGLEGVSIDSANLLNRGLDAYLKGLIRSCIELTKIDSNKHPSSLKLINGVKPQFQMHEQKPDCPISLQDFRVAMEMNPRTLGEEWPLLLEKICTNSFEE